MNLVSGVGRSYFKLEIEDEVQLDSVVSNWDDWDCGPLLEIHPVAARLKLAPFMFRQPARTFRFDYFACSFLDFVSVELARFLESRVRAEFLSIQAMYKKAPVNPRTYCLMHLFDRFDAVDMTKSELTMWEPTLRSGIKSVTSLVLDKEVLGDSRAFFLNELAVVCFRDDLCSEITRAGFKGLVFRPLDDLRFG